MVLGAAETVVGISDAFRPYPERRGLYRPNANRVTRGMAAGWHNPLKGRSRRNSGARETDQTKASRRYLRKNPILTSAASYRIACGRNRELLPVIGFSSSRIDRPQGAWSIGPLPSTGYELEKFGSGARPDE